VRKFGQSGHPVPPLRFSGILSVTRNNVENQVAEFQHVDKIAANPSIAGVR
jgi:hypothetical protein